MNDQLQKIAVETDAWCDQHCSDITMYNQKWEAKFAELIIQECIKAVDETPLGYGDYRDQILESMRNSCAKSIKNHFGVDK
jgi:hypothetical protein